MRKGPNFGNKEHSLATISQFLKTALIDLTKKKCLLQSQTFYDLKMPSQILNYFFPNQIRKVVADLLYFIFFDLYNFI